MDRGCTATVYNRWNVYAPGAPSYVNTLSTLDFGKDYWININITSTITLTLKGPSTAGLTGAGALELPATYYGEVRPGDTFTPTVGMTVTARVGSTVCGQAPAQSVAGQIVYSLQALASSEAAGCGLAGQRVAFSVNGQAMAARPAWDNTQAQYVRLAPARLLYLPLVRR